MLPPNSRWSTIIDEAHVNPDVLRVPEVQRTLHNILQSNISVCTSLGGAFMPQVCVTTAFGHVWSKPLQKLVGFLVCGYKRFVLVKWCDNALTYYQYRAVILFIWVQTS